MNLNLVGQIYESIGDDKALAETIMEIVKLTNSRGAQYGIFDRSGMMLGGHRRCLEGHRWLLYILFILNCRQTDSP